MSFQDILQILQSSTYHMIAAKGLDIKLVFSCNDNFITRGHYTLMAVLKNLVNNAIEAIESGKKAGPGENIRKEGKRSIYIPGGGQWTRHFGAPSAQHFRDGIFDKV